MTEERTGSETVPRCGNRQLRVTSAFLLLSDRWMGCHLSKQKSRGEEQSFARDDEFGFACLEFEFPKKELGGAPL